jgi:hypothetical protein
MLKIPEESVNISAEIKIDKIDSKVTKQLQMFLTYHNDGRQQLAKDKVNHKEMKMWTFVQKIILTKT